MTTAWRCAPCQRMRQIQKPQWSGPRACNLLAKIEFRCGWIGWREWDCVGALLGRSAAVRVAAAWAHASQAVYASCHYNQNFCPPFRERYSPSNPESASIGRNLGWRNLVNLEAYSDKALVECVSISCTWQYVKQNRSNPFRMHSFMFLICGTMPSWDIQRYMESSSNASE